MSVPNFLPPLRHLYNRGCSPATAVAPPHRTSMFFGSRGPWAPHSLWYSLRSFLCIFLRSLWDLRCFPPFPIRDSRGSRARTPLGCKKLAIHLTVRWNSNPVLSNFGGALPSCHLLVDPLASGKGLVSPLRGSWKCIDPHIIFSSPKHAILAPRCLLIPVTGGRWPPITFSRPGHAILAPPLNWAHGPDKPSRPMGQLPPGAITG